MRKTSAFLLSVLFGLGWTGFPGTLSADPAGTEGLMLPASGGDHVYTTNMHGHVYGIHVFTNVTGASSFVLHEPLDVEYLVVGGGGGGARASLRNQSAGGGGGGGVVHGTNSLDVGEYDVTVGAGGLREDDRNDPGQSGEDSSFGGIVALGGGGAGSTDSGSGLDGGSGGGAGGGSDSEGGAGLQPDSPSGGLGHPGGDQAGTSSDSKGGGGGGAMGPGETSADVSGAGADGGAGYETDILGYPAIFGAGGGGGRNNNGLGGLGGGIGPASGAGDGGAPHATDAMPNRGGGGGGGGTHDRGYGGDGGSGIVVIRYKLLFDERPWIETLPPSGIGADRATLNGRLWSTGKTATAVSVYWGPGGDQGTNTADWAHVNHFGYHNPAADELPADYEYEAMELSGATNFTYRFYAVNEEGGFWGAPRTFPLWHAPTATLDAAVEDWTFVELHGTVTAGEPVPEAVFCLHPGSDPGVDSTPSDWERTEPIGESLGSVVKTVHGLNPATNYIVRLYVTNAVAGAWSAPLDIRASEPHDWPMWNYAPDRRGASPVASVLPDTLHLQWSRQLPEPKRAWAPQLDDRDKLEFDVSYSPVVMGDRLFVPSMVTDSLTAYDAATGEKLWRHVVDGPVRLSPVGWEGKVYFASDDGYLYCLDAETGELQWKFRATRSDRRVLGNERVVNMHPVRGGPVIKDGTLYFAAGIWPWQGIFIYALDAATGETVWANDTTGSQWRDLPHSGASGFGGVAPQGYLAASADRLVVAGGRSVPALLDRHTGELIWNNMRVSKWSGGYQVQCDDNYFYNHGRRYSLSDGGGATGSSLPTPQAMVRAQALAAELDSDPFAALAAHRGRLFIATVNGTLYCFGDEPDEVREHAYEPTPPSGESAAARAAQILAESGATAGYALVLGLGDGHLTEQLAVQSDLHVVGMDTNAATVAALRERYIEAGLYGSRIHLLQGEQGSLSYPPYISSLIVAENPETTGFGEDLEDVAYSLLRPYGGKAFLGDTTISRDGPLPDTGQWTHQYANAANNVVSDDGRVRPPLGTLWYGGPSNENVLPRHAAGPRPQVAGGRLVILGVETIGARDVYTGRLLWEREFPGIGHPFTDLSLEERYRDEREVYMTNIPGASYIGSPYATLPDSVYLRHGPDLHRLDAETGVTLATFHLPSSGEGVPPDWGHVSVLGDLLIATYTPHVFDSEEAPELINSTDGGNGELGWRNWNSSSSARLAALDRYTGRVLWTREAAIGFQHNAIVGSRDRVFLIDGVCDPVRAALQRRGLSPFLASRILALNAATGDAVWEKNSDVYGTFLGYCETYDILIEGGTQDGRRDRPDEPSRPNSTMTARRGRDGTPLWQRAGASYAGPVAINGGIIYPGRPGDARSLLTGQALETAHPLTGSPVVWRYRRDYGCNTMNASRHMLLFRSGAAGFVDTTADGGTGTLGGFRAGCTSSMIAADGVLSAPDYTRTCTCNYQQKTSLAMIHMPEMEYWSRIDARSDSGAIRQVGLNLGAPGNRRAPDGVLWLHHPTEGANTPSLSVSVASSGEVAYFRRHPAELQDGDELNWVAASGATGIESLTLSGTQGDAVTLVFAEPDASVQAGDRVFAIRIGGQEVESAFDIVAEAGGANRIVQRRYAVTPGTLTIELEAAPDSLPPLLCGAMVTSAALSAPLHIAYPETSDSGTYVVEWAAALGANAYELQRSADGGDTWSTVHTGSDPFWTESASFGSYRYRVRATNDEGPGDDWREGAHDCVVRIGMRLPYAQDFELRPTDSPASELDGWNADGTDSSRIVETTYEYPEPRPLPNTVHEKALALNGGTLSFAVAMDEGDYCRVYLDMMIRFAPLEPGDPHETCFVRVDGKFAVSLLGEALHLVHGGADGETETTTVFPGPYDSNDWHRLTVAMDMDGLEDGEERIPFFRIFLDGAPLAGDTAGYSEPSPDPSDYSGGAWFRFAGHGEQQAAGRHRILSEIALEGQGMIDDFVLTDAVPPTVPHRLVRTILEPEELGGMFPSGTPISDPFPAWETRVEDGAPIEIAYSAVRFHKIGKLESDEIEVAEAAGQETYVWQRDDVMANVVNRIVFEAKLWKPEDGGDGKSPLWWADARGYADGEALTVYQGFLLNQEDLDHPFNIIAFGLDEENRPFVKWDSAGPAYGEVKVVSATNLVGENAWVPVPGATVHDAGVNTWTGETAADPTTFYRIEVVPVPDGE